MKTAPKQPHPFADLLLTVILPSVVLEYLSKPERLGPAWALGIALLLPVGFGIYCWVNKRGLNFFSIFGLVAIIVTGGLGLLNLNAGWFAAKEAVFPIFLGLAFPFSHRWGKPLINEVLLNPQLINYPLLNLALDTEDKQITFKRLLYRASWSLAIASILAAAANAALAWYLLEGHAPATEGYVKAIGTLNWLGFIVIAVPLVAVTFGLLIHLLGDIQRLTGLDRAALLNQRKATPPETDPDPA